MTTNYIPRITRDEDDFLAELSVWTDGPVPDETIFVGYFSTYQRAYEASIAASTDAATRDVADAALAAQVSDAPTCRTCGGPVEIDGSVGLFDDECDDCAALACEACGGAVSFEDASILGDRMVCGACYAAQQAHVEAMAALVAADERRAYREALAEDGCAADEAQRLSQVLRQQEDEAHDNDEPLRTCAAEDRCARGGW